MPAPSIGSGPEAAVGRSRSSEWIRTTRRESRSGSLRLQPREIGGRACRIACACLLLFVLLSPARAFASGLGGYLEGEWSWSEINDHGEDRGFDASMGGLGVLWDSHVASPDPFNFRLAFGYRLGERDLDAAKDELVNGLTLDTTVGYGLWSNAQWRLWAGPSARLSYDWYSSAGDVDIVDLGIGIGPRVGANFHISETLSVTGSIAYHYTYLSELIERDGKNRTIDGPQHIVGLRIGLLWRDDAYDD